MLEIDASEGGGQLVRSALALAARSGRAVRLDGIRASRPNPGLAAQHLAAVETLAAIADADVTGAELGADSLTFEPAGLAPGTYEVDIGTAGSVTLLFDAVLPLSTAIDRPLAVTARGGTDVAWSPPMDWYRHVKLPLLRRHGIVAAVDVTRRGFYPRGGGEATMTVGPSALSEFDLVGRAGAPSGRVFSTATDDLADASVAERQAEAAAEGLAGQDIDVIERTVRSVASPSTGSAVVVALEWPESTVGLDALGERGTPAEDVGRDAVEAAREAIESPAPLDPYLADQLAIFLALGGGRVAIPRLTDHVETTVALLDQFGLAVSVDESGPVPVLSG